MDVCTPCYTRMPSLTTHSQTVIRPPSRWFGSRRSVPQRKRSPSFCRAARMLSCTIMTLVRRPNWHRSPITSQAERSPRPHQAIYKQDRAAPVDLQSTKQHSMTEVHMCRQCVESDVDLRFDLETTTQSTPERTVISGWCTRCMIDCTKCGFSGLKATEICSNQTAHRGQKLCRNTATRLDRLGCDPCRH